MPQTQELIKGYTVAPIALPTLAAKHHGGAPAPVILGASKAVTFASEPK
jgi:hypothetical protein